jgi:hypothetical protein
MKKQKTTYRQKTRMAAVDEKRQDVTPPDADAAYAWRQYVNEVVDLVKSNCDEFFGKVDVSWEEGGWGVESHWHIRIQRSLYLDVRNAGGEVWAYGTAPKDASVSEIIDAARRIGESATEMSVRAAREIDPNPVRLDVMIDALDQWLANSEDADVDNKKLTAAAVLLESLQATRVARAMTPRCGHCDVELDPGISVDGKGYCSEAHARLAS